MFVVRCRYIAHKGAPEGVGYLDNEARCTRDTRLAKNFDNEADAWTFARLSGEQIPKDCWVEPDGLSTLALDHPKGDLS